MGGATILNCRYDEWVFPNKSELADEEIKATGSSGEIDF